MSHVAHRDNTARMTSPDVARAAAMRLVLSDSVEELERRRDVYRSWLGDVAANRGVYRSRPASAELVAILGRGLAAIDGELRTARQDAAPRHLSAERSMPRALALATRRVR